MTPPVTRQRYAIVAFAMMASMWMYIDRVCISTLADCVQQDLKFDGANKTLSFGGFVLDKKAVILGAFFLTYALFQLPTGSLADRYGQRKVLTACIVGWSVVTAMTGFVQGFLGLLLIRLLLGIAEAGAYPAAAGLVKNWARPQERGRFSGFVAFGGRIGGAVAPFLTALLAVAFISVGPPEWTFQYTTTLVKDGESVVRSQTFNWRMVFVFFGLCGLLVAVLFWLLIRDRPDGAPPPSVSTGPSIPLHRRIAAQLRLLAGSRNMWLFAAVQFGANVGWAPLVTLLPTYLEEVFREPRDQIGKMQSTALLIGCTGMLFGGFVTDYLYQKFGPRWGRSLPIFFAKLGCVGCILAVTQAGSAWTAILFLGAMAFLVDLGNPSIWSFAQDVGGRRVGAALGWGNMFGNLGAFASPIILTEVKNRYDWDTAFVACACCFAIASVAGFLLNASKPLDDQPGESK